MRVAKHTDDPRMNHLLAALPGDEFDRLEPALEPVSLAFGKVLYESGEQLEYIYFPTTAISRSTLRPGMSAPRLASAMLLMFTRN